MVNTQGIRNKKPPKAIRQWIARMVRILFFKISIPMLSVWNRIVLWFWGAKVGNRLVCRGNIRVYNAGQIEIGNDVVLSSGGFENPVGGSIQTTFAIQKGAFLQIGDRCGISNSVFCSRTGITLEDEVFIGGGCSLYDNDFHHLLAEDRFSNHGPVPSAPILIRKRAWIGGHCIILKGVEIGEESVIGAGSVVTHNIPAGVIAAGVPAKVIRKLKKPKK